MKFNTKLLHGGFEPEKTTGSTLTPIYQVSAFAQESAEQLEKVFNNKAPGYAYTRISNPTVAAFENRMNTLEKGVGAVACSSGMAAVTMSLLNILEAGDEIICGAGLFGGTIDLFGDLAAFGIKTKFVKHVTKEEIAHIINSKTKAVFAELIGNPNLEIVDIKSVADLAHENGAVFILDSTTATPYLINPFDYGADIVVHSTSKYINGGGNSISGVIIDSGNFKWDKEKYPGMKEYAKFGKFAFTAKLRNGLFRNTGACMAPQTAFYNMLGLETLGLRMERACFNAEKLAEFLTQYPDIKVNYPALPDSPWHETAEKTLEHGYGAILTIRVGSKERAFQIMNDLKLPKIVSNIGDTKSLIIHPESTLNAHSTEKEKEDAGVFDDLIRISVGIEDIQDIIEDFKYAIEKK